MAPTPTPATHCFICPPPNLTQPVMCGVLPPSFGCTQYGCAGGALEARLPTLPLACATAATLCPHCTGMQTPDCPRVAGQPGGTLHTVATVCTQGFPTFCGCTPGFDCMAPPGGVQTHAPICTQGAPTFCGCTPGLDCAGGAARAAFQARTPITDPTPASHCFVCDPEPMARLAARTPIGHPTPATHCFVCDPEPLARQAMMGAAAPPRPRALADAGDALLRLRSGTVGPSGDDGRSCARGGRCGLADAGDALLHLPAPYPGPELLGSGPGGCAPANIPVSHAEHNMHRPNHAHPGLRALRSNSADELEGVPYPDGWLYGPRLLPGGPAGCRHEVGRIMRHRRNNPAAGLYGPRVPDPGGHLPDTALRGIQSIRLIGEEARGAVAFYPISSAPAARLGRPAP